MGKVGSSPAFRRNNRQNPHPPRVEVDIPVDDLVGLTPEEMARNLAPEALLELAKLVRGKGAAIRHATAKLGAIKELLSYGISKPAQATTISAPDGGPVQSEHVIRFIKPDNPVLKSLRSACKVSGWSWVSFRHNTINGVFIKDAVLLRT